MPLWLIKIFAELKPYYDDIGFISTIITISGFIWRFRKPILNFLKKRLNFFKAIGSIAKHGEDIIQIKNAFDGLKELFGDLSNRIDEVEKSLKNKASNTMQIISRCPKHMVKLDEIGTDFATCLDCGLGNPYPMKDKKITITIAEARIRMAKRFEQANSV